YNRNYVFLEGLKKSEVKIYKFNFNDYGYGNRSILGPFIKHFKELLSIEVDIIIYFSLGQEIFTFLIAKFLSWIKNKKLINDIFISKLLTFYHDRKLKLTRKIKFIPKTFYKFYYYFLDFIECKFSDYLILDTLSHIKFFHDKYNIPTNKFRLLYVGCRKNIFYPLELEKGRKTIKIGYWGSFIPLHGVKYIIKAAKLLENDKKIKFILFGKGQTLKNNKALVKKLGLTNLQLIEGYYKSSELYKLRDLIAEFDIGLGIFGTSEKTNLVIPNKVFEGIAMKLPMISAKSSAIEEVFIDSANIVLCKAGDPQSLANSIKTLAYDDDLKKKIKNNAYNLYKQRFTVEKLAKKLKLILFDIIG
ncbi:MAG: glycosyltransferase, partial [Candidatus Lokiarchaeota archaeon]|nr:glycosyltransferase [Candidatus Lokiarchaeota archaeon]